MTRFIILRHGLSEYNQARRFQGHLDIPLHAIGLEQADATAKYVLAHYKVDRVYSSDLCRAARTAQPIADALGLPLELDARLREIDMGLWQGLGFEEAIARFPETERIRKECLGKLRYDGGESYGDVMARARACADEIAAQNDGKTVVLASHGGTIRALFSSWLGYGPMEMNRVPIVPNASVSVACVDGGRVTFELRDYVDHLAHVTTTDIE